MSSVLAGVKSRLEYQTFEKTGKFTLPPEVVKGAEPLELPEEKEDLIVAIIRNERYAVPVNELEEFIKKYGRKITSKEYRIR